MLLWMGLFSSLSDISLLMYRNATDFCMLILYPVALLNSFILRVFWWSLWGFLYTRSCHLQIEIMLCYSFQFGWHLFLFLVWLLLARTSSTMLKNSGESGYPCLVPDFRGKAFSFSQLSMMLAVDFFIYDLYVEGCCFYTSFVESFYHERVLNFVKCFFCIY